MSIIDRIILSIYTVLLMVLSLVSILLSVKILPPNYWQQGLLLIYGRWEAALIGGVFFLSAFVCCWRECVHGEVPARLSIRRKWV